MCVRFLLAALNLCSGSLAVLPYLSPIAIMKSAVGPVKSKDMKQTGLGKFFGGAAETYDKPIVPDAIRGAYRKRMGPFTPEKAGAEVPSRGKARKKMEVDVAPLAIGDGPVEAIVQLGAENGLVAGAQGVFSPMSIRTSSPM